MNIRSITTFADLSHPVKAETIEKASAALAAAREALERAGYTVQTTRLATQPFPHIVKPGEVVSFAHSLEQAAIEAGISYVSLGPVCINEEAAYVHALPEVFSTTESTFASVETASLETGIDAGRVRLTAELIKHISTIRPDGLTNLMLAALANVPAWAPFFPAAYHGGGKPRIAIATESADLAVDVLGGAGSLVEAHRTLIFNIERHAQAIAEALKPVAGEYGLSWQGIDFSLAPFPDEARSIGRALERLGLTAFGRSGSLTAAAWLTDTLDRAQFKRTGFCGLMLPVLEDAGLAARAAEGTLSVRDLLIYSAVCGTGLDTIPLPGDVSTGALSATLLDVAALALRLDKPLTARLMPLPGLQAGDETPFTFEFFTNTRVMRIDEGAVSGPLNADERVHIQPRPPYQ